MSKSGKEFVVAIGVSVVAIGIAAYLDLNEAWIKFSAPYERFELDELPRGLAILSIALLWFLIRRWRELEKSEKRLRSQIATNEHRERALPRLPIDRSATISALSRPRASFKPVGACRRGAAVGSCTRRGRRFQALRGRAKSCSRVIGLSGHVQSE